MPESEVPAADSRQRIADDRPCIQCGYNLRTMPEAGFCPECGIPASRSQPLWTKPPQLLRRLRFATIALPIAAFCAAYSDNACNWLLRRIAPSSVMAMFNIPVGETVRIHPWQPWAGILTQVLSAVLIGIALVTLNRLSNACAEAGVLSLRHHRVISRIALTAGVLTGVGVVLDSIWRFGVSAGHMHVVIWFAANTITCLLVISAIDLESRLQSLIHRPWQRKFARATLVISIPIGLGCIAGHSVSLVAALVNIPYPIPHVSKFSVEEEPQTYLVIRPDGRVSRTTTAPADQLARSQQYADSFRIGGVAMNLYFIEKDLEKWTLWPWRVLLGITGCLLFRTGWDAQRALRRRPRIESAYITDNSS